MNRIYVWIIVIWYFGVWAMFFCKAEPRRDAIRLLILQEDNRQSIKDLIKDDLCRSEDSGYFAEKKPPESPVLGGTDLGCDSED